jgi:hypothetical protein
LNVQGTKGFWRCLSVAGTRLGNGDARVQVGPPDREVQRMNTYRIERAGRRLPGH